MYLIVLLGMGGVRNLILLLFLLELLSWLFAIFIKESRTKYLLIQRRFLLTSLSGLLWIKELLSLRLLLKIGIPPFHLWMVSLSRRLRLNLFIFFITIHKLGPIRVLSKIIRVYIIVVAWFTSFIVAFNLLPTKSLILILIYSSILHRGWIVRVSIWNYRFFLVYWAVYSLILTMWLSFFKSQDFSIINIKQGSLRNMGWLVLAGMPPFRLFWLKINLFFHFNIIRIILRIVFIFTIIIALRAYFRVFQSSMLLSESNNSSWLPFLLFISVIVFI